MSSLPIRRYTPEQYLEIDRRAEQRSEYVNGEILAMAGASREHNLIVTNLVREVSTRLRGQPCETYSNDLRVKGRATGAFLFPDVIVGCAPLEFEDASLDILLNPVVLMEVLSPTTESNDRGWKFAHYRQMATLTDYVMLSQYQPFVEHYTRHSGDPHSGNQWVLTELRGPEAVLRLPSIGCEMPLSEIYERVEFAPDPVMVALEMPGRDVPSQEKTP
jgi:Uma2 family endonuclease